MGYRKLQARRNELDQKQAVYEQFVKVVTGFNSRLGELQKAAGNLERLKKDTAKAVQGLNPGGVKEFEALQKEMIEMCGSIDPKPVSTASAEKFVKDSKANIDREMDAWLDKLAGSYPANIAPGMSFKNYVSKRILSIESGPEKAKNETLEGDAAVFFKVKFMDGASTSLSKADLSPKKGWKFVKL